MFHVKSAGNKCYFQRICPKHVWTHRLLCDVTVQWFASLRETERESRGCTVWKDWLFHCCITCHWIELHVMHILHNLYILRLSFDRSIHFIAQVWEWTKEACGSQDPTLCSEMTVKFTDACSMHGWSAVMLQTKLTSFLLSFPRPIHSFSRSMFSFWNNSKWA